MFLITILAVMLIIMAVLTVLAIAAGGVVTVVLFGDVIVCALFIIWIIKRLIKRKK